MAKVKYFRARVWNQEGHFDSMKDARRYIESILEIYSNSGINAAMIRWEIIPIYK